mgnify:CR=1 FL=1
MILVFFKILKFIVYSADPAQLIITLGANVHSTDQNGNTALHYAILARNTVCVNLLLDAGATTIMKNSAGDSPLDAAARFSPRVLYPMIVERQKRIDNQKPLAKFKLTKRIEISIPSLKDSRLRYYVMALVPWLGFYSFGIIMQSQTEVSIKAMLFMLVILALIGCAKYIFDRKNISVLAISLYLATKFWLYITYLQYYTFGWFFIFLVCLILMFFNISCIFHSNMVWIFVETGVSLCWPG